MSLYKNYNIYFFNNYHNGDVFYSKEFVRDIKNKIGINHYYIHNNDFSILKDFDINQIRIATPDNSISLSKKNNDLFINTWVGQANAKYLKYNCSLKSNYLIYTDIYKSLEIQIEPINFYIPNVNFEKVDQLNINNFFDNIKKKTVLVCNNNVFSGQSVNFDFDPIINYISDIYKDVLFILTNNSNLSKQNVINVNNIIGYNMKNLLEISYLSTKTDIIIGRGSGPFCFSHIEDNINNDKKTFISFTNNENEGKWVSDSESKAEQYWFNNYDNDYIINSILEVLKNKI